MTEATLRCPGCGTPAAPDAVSCINCRAPLATRTCASCFGAMFVGSAFCTHCGAAGRRELVEDTAVRRCPRCADALQSLRLGSTAARECVQCGGVWVSPGSLQRLVDAQEEAASIVSTLAARVIPSSVPATTVRYLRCPDCARLMNRTNFAKASGVILDVCKPHGVWLDRSELQAVLQFVAAGGLAVARRREHEQLLEDQRRLLALELKPQRPDEG